MLSIYNIARVVDSKIPPGLKTDIWAAGTGAAVWTLHAQFKLTADQLIFTGARWLWEAYLEVL